MGLDIAFNRDRAIAAGLVVTVARNGSPEDIALAMNDDADPDYLNWLQLESELVHIPGTTLVTGNSSTSTEYITLRANHWGRIYTPLTTWLKANGIEWDEF